MILTMTADDTLRRRGCCSLTRLRDHRRDAAIIVQICYKQGVGLMPSHDINDLHQLLCPPLPVRNGPDPFDPARQIIAALIRARVSQWARAIGSQPSPQFREDLVEAILICLLTERQPPKRRSQKRKILRRISTDASAAKKIIRRLDSYLQETPFFYPSIQRRFLELGNLAPELASLSSMARAHADMLLPDRGGTRGLLAFRVLVEGLRRAFEGATGEKASVTWNNYEERYEGSFLNLVRPVSAVVAPSIAHPSSTLAEDAYVYKVVNSARSGRISKQRKKRRIRSLAGKRIRRVHLKG
jgi:hypothetical protein